MSNQLLATTRFRSRGKDAQEVNHMRSKAQVQHPATAIRRRKLQVQNCAFDAVFNVEPSLCDAIENVFLRIDVGAEGNSNKQANWGIDAIKSLSCRSGGEQLMNYPSYKHFLRWCLSNADSVKRAQIEALCFGGADGTGASTIYIPLNYPGSPYSKSFDCKHATPLRLGAMNSKRPITWEVTMNSALATTGSANTVIANCVLEYDEIISNNPEQFRSAFTVHELDVKQYPEELSLSSGTALKTSGLESLQGSWQSIYVSCIKTSDDAPAQNKANVENLDLMQLTIDGVDLQHGSEDSEKRQRLNAVMQGANNASQANRVLFSRKPFYSPTYVEGVLNTDGVKRLELNLKDSNNCKAMIQAVCHRTFFTAGKNLRVREN